MKPQYIDCKTCGGRVEIRGKNCQELPGHIEMSAHCHGMWHVDIIEKKLRKDEVAKFFAVAVKMPKDMSEARRIYGPPPAKPGSEAVSVEVRSPEAGRFIVDELAEDGGWVAQRGFDDEERAQAYLAQRQSDLRALQGEIVV